jgi:hypothetical protein
MPWRGNPGAPWLCGRRDLECLDLGCEGFVECLAEAGDVLVRPGRRGAGPLEFGGCCRDLGPGLLEFEGVLVTPLAQGGELQLCGLQLRLD